MRNLCPQNNQTTQAIFPIRNCVLFNALAHASWKMRHSFISCQQARLFNLFRRILTSRRPLTPPTKLKIHRFWHTRHSRCYWRTWCYTRACFHSQQCSCFDRYGLWKKKPFRVWTKLSVPLPCSSRSQKVRFRFRQCRPHVWPGKRFSRLALSLAYIVQEISAFFFIATSSLHVLHRAVDFWPGINHAGKEERTNQYIPMTIEQ